MRVIVSGGGTSGHINPALTIAGKIRKEDPNAVIEYVGTEKGLETKLVPREGYTIHYVKVEGLKRKLSAENLRVAREAITSVREAKEILRAFRPDVVVGTGGYVCWPVLRAAAALKIPTVVHESNAVPGLATRMLSHFVSKILVNFKESEQKLHVPKSRVLCVGNPVKDEMFTLKKDECRKSLGIGSDEKVLLSFGGSLGARTVNNLMYELIENEMLPHDVRLIHATGSGYWDKARERFLMRDFAQTDENTLKKGNITLHRYIYNMPTVMACADVVICRSGAMTVSEIAAMGKTAIFIPSPNVTDNQQYENAHVLEKAGAAALLEEKDATAQRLADMAKALLSDEKKRRAMETKTKEFVHRTSLDEIYGVIKELAEKKK